VAALEAIQHNDGYLAEQLWNTPPRQQYLNAWAADLTAVLQDRHKKGQRA